MNCKNNSNPPLKHILDEWKIKKILGEGSYGSVSKAKKLDGFIDSHKVDICAIKVIKKKMFNQVEIDVLKQVEASYGFLEYYGYGIDDNNYYIYMEYIEDAKSIRKLLNDGYKFSEKEIMNLIEKVLKAIDHLHHYHNVVHRDIKSDHILLIYEDDINDDNEDGKNLKEVKLIDFGCSKTLEINNTKFSSLVGTYRYTAPEVKSQQGKASRKSDIYSFGCVLLEILGGDLSNIDDNGIPIIPDTIPYKFKIIIQKCLVFDPKGRDTTYEILSRIQNCAHTAGSSYNHSALKVGAISDGVKCLHLSEYNHSALSVGIIPNSVESVNLSSYNHSLSVGVIPNSVLYLNLSSFNHSELAAGVIPNSVTNLNLSSYNHSALTVGVIPYGVKYLDLSSYNHSALTVGILPNSLTSIHLSSYSHSALEVDIIPNSVIDLSLSSYNHSALTVGVIPNSVTSLDLSSYNHSLLVGVIPDRVTNLNLSSYNHSALTGGFLVCGVDQISSGSIPNNVTCLNLSSYNHSALVEGDIPNSVTSLDLLSYNHSALKVGVIPKSVTDLDLYSYNHSPLTVGVIPNGVVYLDLSSYNGSASANGVMKSFKNRFLKIQKKFKDFFSYNDSVINVDVKTDSVDSLDQSSYIDPELTAGVTPNTVNSLDQSSYIHSELTVGVIPNTVVYLNLSSYNHSELTVGIIPNGVVNLDLSSYNHSKLRVGVIPDSVVYLNLSSYNHSALKVGAIPNNVTNLKLLAYNHQLQVDVIPKNVKVLSFNKFNQCIKIDDIPASVTSLDLGEEFKLFKNGADLPEKTIIKLKCSFDFSKKESKSKKLLNQRNYPTSVIYLSLPNYNLELKQNSISNSITTLELGSNFKHIETLAYIPSSVYKLSYLDPEFNESNKSQYLLKIKSHINHTISELFINGQDFSEEFHKLNV